MYSELERPWRVGPFVTMAWHILELWVEETASRYGS